MASTTPNGKRRTLTPRPPVTAAPVTISDLTSFDLVGLTGDQLRALLRRHPDVQRTVVGKRVLVRVDVLLALLDRLATSETEGGEAEAITDDEPTADALLARIGMRRQTA